MSLGFFAIFCFFIIIVLLQVVLWLWKAYKMIRREGNNVWCGCVGCWCGGYRLSMFLAMMSPM